MGLERLKILQIGTIARRMLIDIDGLGRCSSYTLLNSYWSFLVGMVIWAQVRKPKPSGRCYKTRALRSNSSHLEPNITAASTTCNTDVLYCTLSKV